MRLFDIRHGFLAGALCAALFLCACGEEPEIPAAAPDLSELFEDVEADVDVESKTIVLPEGTETFTVDNVAALGGSKCFLARDDDPVDPEIDWDNPVTTGKTFEIGEDGLTLVVLDESNRVVGVWHVTLPESEEESSSSKKAESSSSEEEAEESSSSEAEPSSSEEAESSSDVAAESSSSIEEESSSSEPESSASAPVKLSDLSVAKGTVTVSDSLVYVEVPYGTDLSKIELSPLETATDLRRRVEMEFADDSGNVATYKVVAGVQLPGSDFSARNDFWATTSDAMATKRTAALVSISSLANLSFEGGTATVSTQEVEGSLVFDGSWKMASGFYFSGEYAGETALDIYEQGYTSGTPSTDDSYIANDMTFGKPFTARPVAFEIKYSYHHEKGNSTDYPQKSLVYVMLVGKSGKVVATGAFSDDASTDMATRKVELSYGKDPFGLLSGEYPVAEGLTLGKGTEDVTAIHVMFASSAYAHVVCGGMLGNSDKYRGAKDAALVLDNFRLIY